MAWALVTCLVLSTSGCVPQHPNDNKGTLASLAADDGRPWRGQSVIARKYTFPTGARIVSRGDLANTVRNLADATDAVVIQSDDTVYVALRVGGEDAVSLPVSEAATLERRIKDIDPSTKSVWITTKPGAYADFSAYARYLTSARTVTGMLLTWRSIVRSHFGPQALQSK